LAAASIAEAAAAADHDANEKKTQETAEDGKNEKDDEARQGGIKTVINLCCGVGTMVAMANAVGLDAVGVDLSKERCAPAEKLEIKLDTVLAHRRHTKTLPRPRPAGTGSNANDLTAVN